VICCGHENTRTFDENESNIVGLGNGPLSLATQLRPKTRENFPIV